MQRSLLLLVRVRISPGDAHHVKGQVTIPAAIREKAGLLPHTEVEFRMRGKVVELRPSAKTGRKSRGEMLIEHLRSHRGDINMTTDEIMALTRGDEDSLAGEPSIADTERS